MIADGGAVDFQRAEVYAQWGDRGRAIAALTTAFRNGDAGVVWMNADAMLDPVRDDPRFAGLLARLHV